MEEKTFFSQGDVRVTNARFIVSGQTYAMNGVTSVKQGVNEPSRGGPLLLGIVGLIMLFAIAPLGIILLIFTIVWWVKQKPEWIVILHSSSGEARALVSEDKGYIDSVIAALNDAIVHRG